MGFFVVSALHASDFVIVPIWAGSAFSVEGLLKAVDLINDIRANGNADLRFLRLFINQVDRRTAMTRVSIDQLNKHFPADQIFKTMIPVNAAFQRAENERKTIIRYDPTTLGAKAYRALAKELLEIFLWTAMKNPRGGVARMSTEEPEAKRDEAKPRERRRLKLIESYGAFSDDRLQEVAPEIRGITSDNDAQPTAPQGEVPLSTGEITESITESITQWITQCPLGETEGVKGNQDLENTKHIGKNPPIFTPFASPDGSPNGSPNGSSDGSPNGSSDGSPNLL